MKEINFKTEIREAQKHDFEFITELMQSALEPYYGGDHHAHAKRIFTTHISGGTDHIGQFSHEQKMFILVVDGERAGMLHLVGKHQGNYKISPIILDNKYRGVSGLGTHLLEFGEAYAKNKCARQMYCTVAEQNKSALQFFIRKGYIIAGKSDSHYKSGIREVMMYKFLVTEENEAEFDKASISVVPMEQIHENQAKDLILKLVQPYFYGVNESWVSALFKGYERRFSGDINDKYKFIYVAVNRSNTVLGIAGATPKKGEPIKLMPFVASTMPAFVALLTDIPGLLKQYGHKLYLHIVPSVMEIETLQRLNWELNALMPAAYNDNYTTQQWGYELNNENFMRLLRVKQKFFELIKSGKKTLEVRVGYSNLKQIQAGERIKLCSHRYEQIIRVMDVRCYETFDDMVKVEKAELIAPGLSQNDVLQLLKGIYPPERERLGVIVLDIKPE